MDNFKISIDVPDTVKPLARLSGILLTVYALYWFALGVYRGAYLPYRL